MKRFTGFPTGARRSLTPAIIAATLVCASVGGAAATNRTTTTQVSDAATDATGDVDRDADTTDAQALSADIIQAELSIVDGAAVLNVTTAGARPSSAVTTLDAFLLDDLTQPRQNAVNLAARFSDAQSTATLQTITGVGIRCAVSTAEAGVELTVTVPLYCLGRADALAADVALRSVGVGVASDNVPDGPNALLGPVYDDHESTRWFQFIDQTQDATSAADLHGFAVAVDGTGVHLRIVTDALSTSSQDAIDITLQGDNTVSVRVVPATSATTITNGNVDCSSGPVTYTTSPWFASTLHDITLGAACAQGLTAEIGARATTSVAGQLRDAVSQDGTANTFVGPFPRSAARGAPAARSIPDGCSPSARAPFSDTVGNTHEAAIACLADAAITQGRGDGTYGVTDNLTWGQIASFTARTLTAAGVQLPAADSSADAYDDDTDSVHEDAVNQLAAVGILVDPLSTRQLGVNMAVSRGDMAAVTERAIRFAAGLPAPQAYRGPRFFDDDNGSHHEAAIDMITDRGIVTGRQDGTFGADDNLRRDQMATFLARLVADLS